VDLRFYAGQRFGLLSSFAFEQLLAFHTHPGWGNRLVDSFPHIPFRGLTSLAVHPANPVHPVHPLIYYAFDVTDTVALPSNPDIQRNMVRGPLAGCLK
jgi:hypothetical protein